MREECEAAPYSQAEAGRDWLDEQVAIVAGNVRRLAAEIAVEAAELGRLAASGASLSAQARKLTACLEGVARGAARHDALTDATKTVYGRPVPVDAPTKVLPLPSLPVESFRGDRVIRLTAAEVQEKMSSTGDVPADSQQAHVRPGGPCRDQH